MPCEYYEQLMALNARISRSPKRNKYEQLEHRRGMVQRYSWAIPSDEAIDALVALSPIVEMGAGTGYWASLIKQRGGTVRAFDVHPPGVDHNHYKHTSCYTEVERGTPELLSHYADHTLFLCWPPYREGMAAQCLRSWHGNTLVYCGESVDGCTADYDFFWLLDGEVSRYHAEEWLDDPDQHYAGLSVEACELKTTELYRQRYGDPLGFKLIRRIDIPQWLTINDAMMIYSR